MPKVTTTKKTNIKNKQSSKSRSGVGSGGVNTTKSKINLKLVIPIVLMIAAIGGYLVYTSFAYTTYTYRRGSFSNARDHATGSIISNPKATIVCFETKFQGRYSYSGAGFWMPIPRTTVPYTSSIQIWNPAGRRWSTVKTYYSAAGSTVHTDSHCISAYKNATYRLVFSNNNKIRLTTAISGSYWLYGR